MNEVELGAKAFWLLIGAGVASGVASWWTLRRWSDPVKLRETSNHIVAHLLEFRLFADEPVLVMKAQLSLISANSQLLRQVIGPSLILVVPFAFVLVTMNAVFGRAPLKPGRPAIVTLQWSGPGELEVRAVELKAPPEFRVETPPVLIRTLSQSCWRVRPIGAIASELKLLCGGHVIRKSLSSSPGLQWLSDTRAGSVFGFLFHPLELPFSSKDVKWISINYPPAAIFGCNWLLWFSVASLVGAVASALLSKRLVVIARTIVGRLRY